MTFRTFMQVSLINMLTFIANGIRYIKCKVNAERKSKVDDNTAKMQSIKWLGV